ncbi:hypothetical protein ACB092_05G083200 [Castanea dentata]
MQCSSVMVIRSIQRIKKKGSTRSCLCWVVDTKKARANKIKHIFSIIYIIYRFIIFINLAVQRLIEELGKLLIDPLAKINIFFYYSQEQKRKASLARSWLGWVWTKSKRSFLLFILLI